SLVVTTMVGAAPAQGSVSAEMDTQRPVDMFVTGEASQAIAPADVVAVAETEGLVHAEAVPGTMARVGDEEVLVLGVDETVATASRADDTVPAAGTGEVGSSLATQLDGASGSSLTR